MTKGKDLSNEDKKEILDLLNKNTPERYYVNSLMYVMQL
jgi:hypothetical protein